MIQIYYNIQKSIEFEFGPFDDLEEVIGNLNKKHCLGISYSKRRDSYKIASMMKKDHLNKEVQRIIEKIKELGKG